MGVLPFPVGVRFTIRFVKAEAMLILIVDHRSRFPEALLDSLRLRHVKRSSQATLFDQSSL